MASGGKMVKIGLDQYDIGGVLRGIDDLCNRIEIQVRRGGGGEGEFFRGSMGEGCTDGEIRLDVDQRTFRGWVSKASTGNVEKGHEQENRMDR
jgi:hypothetical protein